MSKNFDYKKWFDYKRFAIRVVKDNEVFYLRKNWYDSPENELIKKSNLTTKDLFISKQYARENLNKLLGTTSKYHKCNFEIVEINRG